MPLTEKSDREILAVADPIMDNLMEGSTAIDHEQHTRDFTDRMKSLWLSSDVHSRWQLFGNNGSRSKRESISLNWFWWKRSPRIWSITRWYSNNSVE